MTNRQRINKQTGQHTKMNTKWKSMKTETNRI